MPTCWCRLQLIKLQKKKKNQKEKLKIIIYVLSYVLFCIGQDWDGTYSLDEVREFGMEIKQAIAEPSLNHSRVIPEPLSRDNV